MDDLVLRLSQGDHPVEVSLRPERTAAALKTRIDDGYVHIKFTTTRGGTELGVRLDRESSNWSNGNFERAEGRIKLSGTLKLNYVPVKCIAEIDLQTLEGLGHLEIVQSSPVA